MPNPTPGSSFNQLGLSSRLQKTLDHLGYEAPTPVQSACIPLLLQGGDLIGQAQTGTGKTAAFALPFIDSIDVRSQGVQLLVLAPTRELAIQVAEAFQSYAHGLKGFHVLPVYGGQAYHHQLRSLKRGVQVVVGTPGRIMDHIDRGTLKLDNLKALILDEADEMLRMGFIEDVEWILGHTPAQRQIALFSATMPTAIKNIAGTYLRSPQVVRIAQAKQSVSTIAQSFHIVNARQKLDALTRVLESLEMDAAIIFVRTKNSTVELAEKLDARGYAVAALNGDIAQQQRERRVEQLKQGKLDIIIATDVAARGLDVSRISHVINYDVPSDNETYVHRIGRTGRAGRSGQAILFITPRERRLLKGLERATAQPIQAFKMPSIEDINSQRERRFHARLQQTIDDEDLADCLRLVESFASTSGNEPVQIAAALARILQGDTPLLLTDEIETTAKAPKQSAKPKRDKPLQTKARPLKEFPDIPMRRYRIEVGHDDAVKPGNIVGAIANEAELDSCYIGSVDIYDSFTLVDLPDGMPAELVKILKKARVANKPMGLKPLDSDESKRKKPRAQGRGKNQKGKQAKRKKHQQRKGKPARTRG